MEENFSGLEKNLKFSEKVRHHKLIFNVENVLIIAESLGLKIFTNLIQVNSPLHLNWYFTTSY